MSVSVVSPTEGLRRFVELSRQAPTDPYRSLEPFRFADSGILAARDREVERLVRLITMYRGVLLYGESGAGKTSVVNAGLLPRLMNEGFWPHRIRVQPQAGKELVLEPIACSDGGEDACLPSAFAGAGDDGQLVIAANAFLDAVRTAAEHGPILLVFDQFEELVTLFQQATASEPQAAIIEAISTLLRDGMLEHAVESKPMVRVKLLFAFREDYLAGLRPLLDEQPELVHQSLRLVAPPLSAAEEIIRAPFEKYPGSYRPELSPELAERIAESLKRHGDGRQTPLSVLQIVCGQLWRAKDPSALLADRGVDGLLQDHMEQALAQLPGDLRDAAVAVLGQMITESNTRNVVAAPDLVSRAAADQEDLDPALLRKAIDLLETDSGLIRRERRHDLDLYELTSEFLIPWISRQRDQLAAARAHRRQARRERRQRLIIAVIAAILVAFIALAKITLDQRNTARRQRTAATDLELASTAQGLLSIRPDVSLVLALAAYHNSPDLSEVRTSILAALEQTKGSGAIGILHGSTNSVTSVAFDPNGRLLAAASADGTIRLWNTATHRQVGQLLGITKGGAFSLAFGDDGRTIAAGAENGTVRLWDVPSRRLLGPPLQIQQGIVISVAFSSDDRWLAAAGLDAGIKLVHIANRVPSRPVLGFPGSDLVRSIAFSPDSATLASVGNTGEVQLWNVATRMPAGRPLHLRQPLFTLAFNPVDPNQLATGSLNGTIDLITVNNPNVAVLGKVNGPAITSVAFSPDGRLLAAGNAADAIQLWNVRSELPSGPPLNGHDGVVTSVSFSPDGHTLASGSTDRTIRLWPITADTFGQPLKPNLGRANGVAFSAHDGKFAAGGPHGIYVWPLVSGVPSGTGSPEITSVHVRSLAFDPADGTLASGSQGGTFERWQINGKTIGSPVTDLGQGVYTIAFGLDGRLVAFAGNRGTITLRDLTVQRRVLKPGPERIFSLAFSPNGQVLASGGDDRMIRLWRVSTGNQLGATQFAQLTGDSDAVFSLAFSAKGVLASGSADDTVRLWDVATGQEIGQPLLGHHGWVKSLAFSPNGNTLASGSSDGTIRLWDVASGAQIGEPLSANRQAIESLAFSPNGRNFVSGGDDGAVRVWPLYVLPSSYGSLRNTVCSLVGTGLSRAEWSEYAPNVGYTNPCS